MNFENPKDLYYPDKDTLRGIKGRIRKREIEETGGGQAYLDKHVGRTKK